MIKSILILVLFICTMGSYSQSFKEKEIRHTIIVKEVQEYNFLESAADYLSSDIKIRYYYSKFCFRLSVRNFFNIYADEPNFNFDNLTNKNVVDFNKVNINRDIPVYFKGKIIYKF